MSEKESGGWMETVRTVIYAVLIALVVRTFAYEPFNIPSGSMLPTLKVGDYLFVSKFSYGYSRYSLPWALPLFDGRILADEPERGDVVVFKLPSDGKTDYIKRIVGLPGDRIQVADGILTINGQAVTREEVGVVEGRYGPITEYIETLPGGTQHRIWEESDDREYDRTEVFTVPEGHYFAMGDNRDHSLDSRAGHVAGTPGVGFVPYDNLIGRAEFLFFSHDGSARLWEVWKWPSAIRFGRIGEGID